MVTYPQTASHFREWVLRAALDAITAKGLDDDGFAMFERTVWGEWWRLRGEVAGTRVEDFNVRGAWNAAVRAWNAIEPSGAGCFELRPVYRCVKCKKQVTGPVWGTVVCGDCAANEEDERHPDTCLCQRCYFLAQDRAHSEESSHGEAN